MTKLFYECKLPDGTVKTVRTLEESENLTKDGGTFKLMYEYKASSSNGYARKDSRKYGDMR